MRLALTILLAASAISLSLQATWASEDSMKLAPPIEQCIRSNAADVERAIPNLDQAVSFLVNGVCAAQVNAEYDRLLDLQEQKRRTQFFKMCEDEKTKNHDAAKDNSPAADALCRPEIMESMTAPSSTGDDVRAYGMQPHSPEANSLAARVLLDLRLAHLNSKSQ